MKKLVGMESEYLISTRETSAAIDQNRFPNDLVLQNMGPRAAYCMLR
jgi:hypothetical protein